MLRMGDTAPIEPAAGPSTLQAKPRCGACVGGRRPRRLRRELSRTADDWL